MISAADTNWDRLGPMFSDAIIDTLVMVAFAMVVGGVLGLVVGVFLFTTRENGILQNKVVYTILNLSLIHI